MASRIIFALMVCQPAIYFRISEGITRGFNGARVQSYERRISWKLTGASGDVYLFNETWVKSLPRGSCVLLRKIFESKKLWIFPADQHSSAGDWIHNLVHGSSRWFTHAREKLSREKITRLLSSSKSFAHLRRMKIARDNIRNRKTTKWCVRDLCANHTLVKRQAELWVTLIHKHSWNATKSATIRCLSRAQCLRAGKISILFKIIFSRDSIFLYRIINYLFTVTCQI